MIQVTPQMRILVATSPVDFRKGIDGMAQQCRVHLQSDPFSGTVFVFHNRSGTALRILVYDGQGFWLCHKRLSSGRYRWWPGDGRRSSVRLEAHELQVLLHGGDPTRTQAAPTWRRVGPEN
jgi:transposase